MSSAERAAPVLPAEAAALFADLAECPCLVLAVSGGPDSTALLVLAARWRANLQCGLKLIAVTVDHGLRPESAKEARAVKLLAQKLGVEHRTLRWTDSKPATGLQAAARQARYRLLAAAARKARARHIVTAHTLDDQAETILIRLTRGSGLTGLAGMARVFPLPASGESEIMLVRPFLDIPKVRLIATLEVAGIAFADDPSNRDPRFTRARMRRVMNALAAEGLDAARLALLARRTARAEAAIESAVGAAKARLALTQWSNSGPIMLDARGFADLPAEVALRLLGRAIAQVGDEGPVELGKLEALFAGLCKDRNGPGGAARVRRTLAGALIMWDADRLTVERAPARRSGRRDRGRELGRKRGLY